MPPFKIDIHANLHRVKIKNNVATPPTKRVVRSETQKNRPTDSRHDVAGHDMTITCHADEKVGTLRRIVFLSNHLLAPSM